MIYINERPLLFDGVKTIKNSSDFPLVISSSVLYIIDGMIDMGTVSVEVPSTGLYLAGHGLNVSSLYSSEDNYTMFTSPVGGSGDVFYDRMSLSVTGSNSQLFNLTASTGLEAAEFNIVNFSNCTSIGSFNNYRQGLENGTGRLGGTPEITLTGEWLGGYRITTSIVRGLDDSYTGTLFKAGAGFTMSSRFLTDVNCDLPINASFSDFSPSNFTAPSLHQVRGAIFTRDGNDPESGDNNFFPNLDPENLVCSWRDNDGLRNTHEGGVSTITSEATTVVTTTSTYYDLAGTYTVTDLQHFSSPSDGVLRNDGNNPTEFSINSSLTLESTANDSLSIKVVKWNIDTLSFEDVVTQNTTVNSLSGPRDVAFATINYNVRLLSGEYVKLQVANLSGADDITAEIGSYFQIKTR